MWLKFCVDLNKISEVIQLLVMTVFFCVTLNVLYELSLFLLITLDYLLDDSHIYAGSILRITQNLPRYLLFTLLLFV